MGTNVLIKGKVFDRFIKGFGRLRDVEGSVGKVMRKYGELREEEGMIYDEGDRHSFVDDMSIRIAGCEAESDYWEGLKENGGGVRGVVGYLCDRFSEVLCDGGGEAETRVHLVMLSWVLDEARKVEGL